MRLTARPTNGQTDVRKDPFTYEDASKKILKGMMLQNLAVEKRNKSTKQRRYSWVLWDLVASGGLFPIRTVGLIV